MIVEIDAETGRFKIHKYFAVHDSGRVINPLLAEANLHGGFLQGIGGAAHEHLVYDDDGQLLTTTFMDYTCPTAVEVPLFEVEHQETLSPFTPLGTKGVGESGVAGALSGLCSAIENALPHLDLRFTDLPLSPNAVWNAIQEAEEQRT
jgi:CO/xanthine dehydrogenase Mo-binding subunit